MPISKEDRARYPANWREISNRIRFERAGGRCEFEVDGERCEARHGLKHPVTGSTVVLTVAHLDHTPEHCEDDNLRAGCQRCHLSYDRDHHARSRRRNKERERRRVMDKAGQLAFEAQCFGGR